MPFLIVDVSYKYKPGYQCWSYTSGRRYGHGTVILIYSCTKKNTVIVPKLILWV